LPLSETGHGIRCILCVRIYVSVSGRRGGVYVRIWIIGVYKNGTRTQQQ